MAATASPRPFSSPRGVGGSSIEDWLNLDAAGDAIGYTPGTSTSDAFPFQSKQPTFDFDYNPTTSTSSFFPSLDLFDPSNSSSSGPSLTIPPTANTTGSGSVDPSSLMFDGFGTGMGMNIDNSALASPLTFSPSSASSTTGDVSGSKAAAGGAGTDRMSDIEVFTSTPGGGSIPFAVDPSLTHPRRLSFLDETENSTIDEAGGDIPVEEESFVPKEEDDDEEEGRMVLGGGGGRDTPVARGATKKSSRAVTTTAINRSLSVLSSTPGPSTSTSTKAVKEGRGQHPHALVDVPDWGDRPSEEEYKKMSSKEKRQLRNKISARNFRHRRKEHIGTLEQQVAERDQLIDSLRSELSSTRDDNKELRGEVEMLKTKWNDLMKRIEDMSNTSTSANTTSTTGVAKRTGAAGVLPQVNRFKDVGTSRRAFDSTGGMFSNNNIGVHTTLIQQVPVDPTALPVAKNMNPALNNLSSAQKSSFSKGLFTAHLRGSLAAPTSENTNNANEGDFFSSNPFRLSPEALLDMKKSLYGKQAHNAPAFLAAEQGKRDQVPEGFRPAFWADPTKKEVLAAVGGKSTRGGLEPRDVESAALSRFLEEEAKQGRLVRTPTPTPTRKATPTKDRDSAVVVKQEDADEEEKTGVSEEDRAKMAFVATLAATFLLQRMTSLFLDAFRSPSPEGEGIDMVKLRAVLEGKSELRVVEETQRESSPVASPAASTLSYDSDSTAVDSLNLSLAQLNVGRAAGSELGIRRCAMNAWAAHHRGVGVGVGVGGEGNGTRPRSPAAATSQ